MPSSVRLFRLATAIVTMGLVLFIMNFTDARSARWVAGGVLAFGALQWLFLGKLERQFRLEDEAMARGDHNGDAPGGDSPS